MACLALLFHLLLAVAARRLAPLPPTVSARTSVLVARPASRATLPVVRDAPRARVAVAAAPGRATQGQEVVTQGRHGRRSALVAAGTVALSLAGPAQQAHGIWPFGDDVQGKSEEDSKTQFQNLYPIQFIAALGNPEATSGVGAEEWGLWTKDPGPRGVSLSRIDRVRTAKNGVTPIGWKFDDADWYVEEHGLIMEKPTGGDGGSGEKLKPGKYIVTGDRKVTTVLTVSPPDPTGAMKWQLGAGKLYDVTHLPCRTGRYTGPACTPANAKQSDFPVQPGALMPPVEGCNKVDYAVLFVIARAV